MSHIVLMPQPHSWDSRCSTCTAHSNVSQENKTLTSALCYTPLGTLTGEEGHNRFGVKDQDFLHSLSCL